MKRKTLITSILVIVLCLALISGSTYSLFTSESSVNMVVTSGKVDVSATVTDLKVYSATADPNAQSTTGLAGEIQTGPFAGTYYYQGPLANNTFANGGTAAWATDTKVLTIDKITPGDKVTLNVDVQNNSNVAIQYRVRVNVLSGLKLYEGLVVKTDNISLSGVQKVGNWTYLPYDANTTALATIPVEIYLPLEAGNTYQDLSTSLRITVEAVQGNANVTNDSLTVPVQANVAVSDTNVDAVITDDSNLVTVTVPAAGIDSETTSLAVNVTPQDTVSNINITSTQESRSYDVEVLVTKSTSQSTTTYSDDNNKVTIRMFIGTGLTGVKLYHVETEITQFNYDSTTGYIEFQTGSFSEYTVLYNKDIAVETINQQTQESTIKVYTPTETTGVYEDEDGNMCEISINETSKEVEVSGPDTIDNMEELNEYITGEKVLGVIGASFDVTDAMELGGDKILDLNGYTLNISLSSGRPFVFSNGQSMIVNANNGGMNIINNQTYGLFRIQSPGVKLVLNGGTYTGYTPDASAIIWVGNTAHILTEGVVIELVNVTANCIGQFVRDSSLNVYYNPYKGYSYREDGAVANKLIVKGGTYTFNNGGVNVNGSISGFVLQSMESEFYGVTATSAIGSIMEVDNGIAYFEDNNFLVENSNGIQDWNATTIGAAFEATITIESGRYSGFYGISVFTSGGHIVMNGGEVSGTSHAFDLYDDDNRSENNQNTTLDIYGGTINGDIYKRGTEAVVVDHR